MCLRMYLLHHCACVLVQTNQLPSPGEPAPAAEAQESPHFFSPKKQKTAGGHVVSGFPQDHIHSLCLVPLQLYSENGIFEPASVFCA